MNIYDPDEVNVNEALTLHEADVVNEISEGEFWEELLWADAFHAEESKE